MIEFSDHAKERIRQRKISKAQVIDTIQNPDKIVASYRTRKIYQKRIENKILEVVTITEKDLTIIVTAYFLENYEN